MDQLVNVITIPAPALPRAAAPPSAAVAGVPTQVLNAAPFDITGVVLNDSALTGTPSPGLTLAGQVSPPLAGKLDPNAGNAIAVIFEGGGWKTSLDVPAGPPRPLTLLCFWNGCVMTDYNGEMRTIMWR
jgi:hypothetical protein